MAISLNPKFSSAYNNRGILRQKLDDFLGSVEDFTEAIKINHNLAQLCKNIFNLIIEEFSNN